MTRYFMTIPDACELITKAAKIGKGGEIYLLDMGEPVKIMDLAKTMIQISGKRVPIKITGTRPGEKLTEELYDSKKEKLIKTKYPNISQVVCK
jgi:UDP-N-acetylglucosamine 4,6-dehydratase